MNAQGASTQYGKFEVVNFLKERFPIGSYILDVGAGNGNWGIYFGSGYNLEAVEIWHDSVEHLSELRDSNRCYTYIYEEDIRNFNYTKHYDLIIFGDIIEHLSVQDAKKVLQTASKNSDHILIGVPYQYKQDAIYGNDNEKHIQDDLTHNIFKKRYPGYDLFLGDMTFYGYYYK